MPLDSTRLLPELLRILGRDGVISDPDALLTYECDALTTLRAPPGLVLFPRDTAQVAQVAKLLHDAQVPFVPRGAGTGLSGGALALNGAVVLSLTRMDKILEIDPVNRVARVQPGVVNALLSAALLPFGLAYAPDPSSQAVCTLGGNIAENAGGPRCLKYGTTVNHVSALTVVLPDGEVVKLGGNGEQQGLDLVGVFVGSEGTFGIATEIEVRLIALPEAAMTLLAVFRDVSTASASVSAFIEAGIIPAALELLDQEAIKAVEASAFAAGYPATAGAALVIELDGARAALPRLAERLRDICVRLGAVEVRVARDEADRVKLWQARKKIYAVTARLAPDLLVQDIVLPRSQLARMMAELYEVAESHGLRIVTVGHLGDGNIHPTILFDRRNASEVERVERASEQMLKACVAAGGSITGEHGVGVDKRKHLGLMFGDVELSAMCDVRRVFNPDDLLNPGKVLPHRNCREWAGTDTASSQSPPSQRDLYARVVPASDE